MGRREEIEEKILRRVRLVPCHEPGLELTHCWVWQGPTSGDGRGGGYPRMNLDGATVAVHKAMWVNQHGIIPPKKQLDHRCHTRGCVNPGHLELVTHLKNQRRRAARAKETRVEHRRD
jgi:hypothetical protein